MFPIISKQPPAANGQPGRKIFESVRQSMGRRGGRLIKISSEIQRKRLLPRYWYIYIGVGTRGRIFRVRTTNLVILHSYILIRLAKYPRWFLNSSKNRGFVVGWKSRFIMRLLWVEQPKASSSSSFLILEWKWESWRYTRDRNVNEASAMLHRVSPGFVSIILHVRSYVRPRVWPATVQQHCVSLFGGRRERDSPRTG